MLDCPILLRTPDNHIRLHEIGNIFCHEPGPCIRVVDAEVAIPKRCPIDMAQVERVGREVAE